MNKWRCNKNKFTEFTFGKVIQSYYFLTVIVVLNLEDVLLASDNNDHDRLICKCFFFYISVNAAYSNVMYYGDLRKSSLDI